MKTIFLTSNSPGEVTTFARPVLSELNRRHPDWNCQICLVPCPYATGAEAKVISGWSERPKVWTPWQTTKAWWSGVKTSGDGAVVFLGGDPWHALLLKSRFGIPALAYFPAHSSWEKTKWLGGFDAVALGYSQPDAGFSSLASRMGERIAVGDLRVDAVNARLREVATEPPKRLRTTSGEASQTLALFPGSRWLHLKASLGVFLRAAELTAEHVPGLEVIMAGSPFVTPERLANAAQRPFDLGLATTTARFKDNELLTERGLRVKVHWDNSPAVIAECDFALSLPGTNTAELAIAGKPTVVPLSDKAPVGGGGLLGLLDRMPGLLPGLSGVKRWMKNRKKNRLTYLALPNQLANREVMPEFWVHDDLSNLIEILIDLACDPERRRLIGEDAQSVMGPPGASGRFVDVLEGILEV